MQDGTPTYQQMTTSTTNYATYATQNTINAYKFQTPDSNELTPFSHTKKSFLQESVQQLNKQYQEMMQLNGGIAYTNGEDNESSPEYNKKVAFTKRTTAKFRSMDLTS